MRSQPPTGSPDPGANSALGRGIAATVTVGAAGLLAFPIADAWIAQRPTALGMTVLSAVEIVILAFGLHPRVVAPEALSRPAQRPVWRHVGWLAVACLPWAWLIVLTPLAGYLGLVLYFLALWTLPFGVGAVTALGLALLTGFGQGVHHGWSAGAFIGPLASAAMIVLVVAAFRALIAESTSRAELIRELQATQAQLAATEHRAGVLDERTRLGRELHDTVAQHLSSIQLLLHAAESAMDANRGDTARLRLDQARAAAAAALDETRAFIRDLTPTPLAGQTLGGALQRLAETVTARGEIAVESDITEAARGPFPVDVETTALRIAQEALANVERHAKASSAAILLDLDGDAITLEIVDNGVGFDPETEFDRSAAGRSDGGGHGLAGMRARTADIGGSAAIVAAPGEGTVVSVRLPVRRISANCPQGNGETR